MGKVAVTRLDYQMVSNTPPPAVTVEQEAYWCGTCGGHLVAHLGALCPVCVDINRYKARPVAHDVEAHRTAYLLELEL